MAKRKRQVSKNDKDFTLTEQLDDYVLPSASDLAEYKQVDPELIPFLQQVASKEQDFRHSMNKEALSMSKREQSLTHGVNYFALLLSFIIVSGAMYISWDLIKNDKNLEGSIFGGIGLLYILYLIISVAKRVKPPSSET